MRLLATIGGLVVIAFAITGAGPAAAHTLVPVAGTPAEVRAGYTEALERLSARSRLAGLAGAPGAMGVNLSENVEYLGSRAEEGGQLAAGGRLVDGYFFVTGSRFISIYDVARPEDPQLTSRIEFPTPRFENEDVATNGKILLYSDFATTGSLYVYDVSDKRNPKQIAELPGAGTHTMTCIRDCQFAYGSYRVENGSTRNGEVVDLRDPANPKVVGDWTDNGVLPSRSVHDVTEVSRDRVLTASAPAQLLDTSESVVEPKVLAKVDGSDGVHGTVWPRQGRDRFLFTGDETNAQPDCTRSGEVRSYDATQWQTTGRFPQLGSFQLRNGTGADGNPPANTGLGCSPHWFDPRPDFADGGVIAMGSYDHGLRFLRVDGQGKIEEIGRFRADETQASAAYWITDDIVYVVDYTRGLDIVRFKEPARSGVPTPAADGTSEAPGGSGGSGSADGANRPIPPTSPPAPPPAASGNVLRVSLAVDRTGVREALRRGIRIRLRCSRACRASHELTVAGRGARRVATGKLVLDRAGRRIVRLKFSRASRRALRVALRRGRTTRLTLKTVVVDAAGGTRLAIERDVRLRARRRAAQR